MSFFADPRFLFYFFEGKILGGNPPINSSMNGFDMKVF